MSNEFEVGDFKENDRGEIEFKFQPGFDPRSDAIKAVDEALEAAYKEGWILRDPVNLDWEGIPFDETLPPDSPHQGGTWTLGQDLITPQDCEGIDHV